MKFFRRYINILTKVKVLSKKRHFQTKLINSKNDASKTWEIIKLVLPNKQNEEPPKLMRVRGSVSDDIQIIANEFNEFFRTIGQKLANDIHTKAGPKPCEFLTNRVSETIFFLGLPSNNEILNLITSLKDNKAVGHDNIPAFYIKVVSLPTSNFS